MCIFEWLLIVCIYDYLSGNAFFDKPETADNEYFVKWYVQADVKDMNSILDCV